MIVEKINLTTVLHILIACVSSNRKYGQVYQ